MSRPCQDGFSLLTATGLVGLAGLGAALGALPGLDAVPEPWGAAPLALLGIAAWARRRRDGRAANRLRNLRIELRLPAGLREGELTFRPAGPALWQARRAGWQVALRRVDAAALCWQFGLTRLDSPDPALPLAAAASLDAALCLARRLLPGMAEPDLRGLLDCDLAFPLASLGAGEHGIDALAEGGYALRGPEGCHAIAPVQAEALLLRGGTVAVA